MFEVRWGSFSRQ